MGRIDPKEEFRKRNLRLKKNVTGFSGTLKPKEKDGRERRELSIRVYVEKKEDPSALTERDLIPPVIDGIKTDIHEVGHITAQPCDSSRKNHHRPAKAGHSAMSRGGTACTLGWFARDTTDGEVVIIANNHCTAGENKHPIGHPYMQPSPLDGNPRQLGTLKRYVPIQFDTYTCPYRQLATRALNIRHQTAYNKVDLGIITVPRPDILIETNCFSVRGKRLGERFEKAMKSGRTTGYTRDGTLIDNDYHGKVSYSRGKAWFGPCGLIRGDEFTLGGDSSSAIVWQDDNRFGGLGFAGSSSHSIFCHYRFIEEYDLRILSS